MRKSTVKEVDRERRGHRVRLTSETARGGEEMREGLNRKLNQLLPDHMEHVSVRDDARKPARTHGRE